MKILIKALTQDVGERLLLWAEKPKNKNDCTIESRDPVIISEIYKASAIRYMLKGMCKKLKISEITVTNNETYNNTIKNDLEKKVSKTIKVDRSEIEIEVIQNE